MDTLILTTEEIKKTVGQYAAGFVKQGMIIGLGTGTTVYWLIHELGIRVKQGLDISIVPTSRQTSQLAAEAEISVTDLNTVDRLPLTIDGADELDPQGRMIKGGGGALLQEKIVAAASDQLLIIADYSKLVEQLGKFSLPVEVIPFGYKQVTRQLVNSGRCANPVLRQHEGQPFISDHGHYILDCPFEKIEDPWGLNAALHLLPGVVETGLFIGMADESVIGYPDGQLRQTKYKKKESLNPLHLPTR